MTDTSYLS